MSFDSLVNIASQFGAVGLVLLASGWYIFRRDEQHNTDRQRLEEKHAIERKEYSDLIARQHTEALAQSASTSKALDNNTNVLSRLTTMIEANTAGRR